MLTVKGAEFGTNFQFLLVSMQSERYWRKHFHNLLKVSIFDKTRSVLNIQYKNM